MTVFKPDPAISRSDTDSASRIIYWLGGLACIIFFAYCLATFLIMMFIGPPPKTVEECFLLLNENKLAGLLRLDILTVFTMPLYYIIFFSIYFAIKRSDQGMALFSTLLIFVGLTLYLSTASVFSYLNLSEKYATATTDLEKNQILAAGEAIFSSDMWRGTSAFIGGLLLQTGALLISFLMLKSNVFSKITAYTGIFIYGLDLIHIIMALFLPVLSSILMVIAGTFYLLWFALVGFRLFSLSKNTV